MTQTLLAATTSATPTSTLTVTSSTVSTLAATAASQWMAAGGPSDLLSRVSFVVADLPAGVLAQTRGDVIYIDRDAAGFGWYTATSASPFTTSSAGDLVAAKGSLAYGRMDLLTVLLHELGHVLGLTNEDAGPGRVMLGSLPAGVRRILPTGYLLL